MLSVRESVFDKMDSNEHPTCTIIKLLRVQTLETDA